MQQSQPTPLLVAQATQVYGLSIPNPEAATLTRKVVRISLLLLILQVTFSFYNSFALGQSDFMGSAFVSFLIPMCGYFGAKYRNRGLVIAFSMCNCLQAVFVPVVVTFIVFLFHSLSEHLSDWCPNGPVGLPIFANSTTGGAGVVTVNGQAVTCADLYDYKNHSGTIYAFLIPVGIVSTIMACLSCSWGFKLANTRYFTVPVTQFRTGAVATVAAPAVTYAAPQPQQGYAVGATIVGQQPQPNKSVPAIIIA